MCSISSAGSSNGSPHHQLNSQNNHHHHHQFLNNKSGGHVKPPNPLRLSSVSSQDSGFTSQDTLFLRPGSPKRLLPASNSSVVDGSERPHTISTAYEKGHQRPQLQPYTFSPPESTLTIHECEQDEQQVATTGNGSLNGSEVNNGRNSSCGDQPPSRSGSSLGKKPPVPQRIGQLSQDHRPMLPSKTMAATMAAAKQQQLQMLHQHQQQQQGSQQLPSFTANKNDMGEFCRKQFFCASFGRKSVEEPLNISF